MLADSYYVNPDGSDENPGTQELPWQSIQYAIQHLSGGDTLTITAGEYIEPDGIMITNELTPNISGTQTDLTELIAQQGVVLTVDNDVDPIITIEGSQSSPIEFIDIKGFHLNYASSGLRLNYTNQCSITQNIITNCTKGIEISNSSYCRITYNKIFGHHTGILMENAQNTTVSYNNCSKGTRDWIHVSTGCQNSSITDNICIDNSTTEPFGSESWWMTNAGIYIESSDSLNIERNLLKDNKHNKSNYIYDASGLFFNGSATNISVLNNSFINNNIHLHHALQQVITLRIWEYTEGNTHGSIPIMMVCLMTGK